MTFRRRARRGGGDRQPPVSPELQLLLVAAESLGMAQEDFAEGYSALAGIIKNPTASDAAAADALMLRCLDMLEANGRTRFGDAEIAALRQEIIDRRGPAFVNEVAATGEPAHVAAVRIRYSRVNLARVARLLHHRTKWRATIGGWQRRFTGGRRHRSGSGQRSGRPTLRGLASALSSSSSSTNRVSTRTSSRVSASPNTQSDEPAASLSARRSLLRRLCGSSTAGARSVSGAR